MKGGIKVRLLAFVVLSAVGVVYVTANYLGFIDKVLGRGITVHATLPESGGLFEGSEVTYRGVKVGKVSKMTAVEDGVRLDLALEDDSKLPQDSLMYVHNLSAVGEQYLDFEPPDGQGPYAGEGFTFRGTEESLPVGEDALLVDLDAFVNSVDRPALGVVIGELGTLFHDTAQPLQTLIEAGTDFIDEAAAHTDETIALLHNGLRVLQTQRANGENITSFAHDLSLLTRSLAASDQHLRTVLQGTPGAAKEVQGLLEELGPTLPVLLGNLVTNNQLVYSYLDGVETLLVEFPLAIAAGFTGTPGDGYGHVNLQMTQDPGPCTGEGYKPMSEWRSGHDLTDGPIYPAHCTKGVPYVQRGSRYAPAPRNPGELYRGAFDPATGMGSAVNADGDPVAIHSPENLSVLGDDSWKWLLVGPVAQR
jgi:phospholipid/cholesterol/gamma-HCH transport system substrate-binding protein